jgi:hypothetical protein
MLNHFGDGHISQDPLSSHILRAALLHYTQPLDEFSSNTEDTSIQHVDLQHCATLESEVIA